jgi:hypothetical protein
VGAALSGSLVTIESAATLTGTGTVNAPILANGTISPGSGIGTLNVVGDATLAGVLAIEVDGATVDKLAVTGNLAAGGTIVLTETGAGFTAPFYVIAQCSGTLSGTIIAPAGYSATISSQQIILAKLIDYTTWAATNAGGQSADLDFDHDGVANGVEYFMGETGSTFTINPSLVGGKITWPRDPNAVALFQIQVSESLTSDWIDVSTADPNVDLTIENQITFTLPVDAARKFCRLKIIFP